MDLHEKKCVIFQLIYTCFVLLFFVVVFFGVISRKITVQLDNNIISIFLALHGVKFKI